MADPLAPAGTDSPPVNLTRFREMAGRSDEEMRCFRRMFLDRTADLMQRLDEALASVRADESCELAHKGAGASAMSGVPGLAARLAEMERLIRQGHAAEAQACFGVAQRELERVRQFLDRAVPLS